MSPDRQLKASLAGLAVTAVCCFTPALVLLLAALGLSAVAGYLDYVLLPAMVGFVGLAVAPLPQARRLMLERLSVITCPSCGRSEAETMPTNACLYFYDCKGCGVRLKPLPGHCCVFCSFGSVPCPPVQEAGGGG